MTAPTSPIELTGTGTRFATEPAPLPAGFLDRLTAIAEVVTDVEAVADASRDWWPLALHWALAGQVPQRAAVVARPADTSQVSQVLALCDEARVPVTAAGGRSGVCGASVPVFGGVLLDMTRLDRIGDVDAIAGIVEVEAGVFGPDLESRPAWGTRADGRPLPAELRHLDRRWVGGVPWSGPVLDPLRQDRGHGRRARGRACRRRVVRTARPRQPRGPISHNCSPAARERWA